jgi:hypothetical protein
MTDLPDYPGTPDLETLARVTHATADLALKSSLHGAACIKIVQAIVQDLAARDPEIVDRLRRVFEISTIVPDIAPSVDLILRGITRPDDPAAVHERDLTAPKH